MAATTSIPDKQKALFIFFWSDKGTTGCYSQWFITKFIDQDGIEFNSSEQYMMYKKAELFGDEKTAKMILEEKSPREIKKYGRLVANFNSRTWDAKKEDIVVRGNVHKFMQNPDILYRLITDGEKASFVEASPYDAIWGIGFNERNALGSIEQWGLNLLGKCLDAARLICIEILSETEQGKAYLARCRRARRKFDVSDVDKNQIINLDLKRLSKSKSKILEELGRIDECEEE